MRTTTQLCAVAVALVLGASPAVAAGTHVSAKSWHVYTGDTLHKVPPGGSFETCPSDPVTELYLQGKVSGAKKGKEFTETWRKDGVKQATVHATWSKAGSFRDYFGYVPDDGSVPDGTWKVTLVQGGSKIGGSKVVLGTPDGC